MAKKETESETEQVQAAMNEPCTGYRKPLNHLKAWGDADWTKPLTERLNVATVDEWLDTNVASKIPVRKSWYLALTQPPSVKETLGEVRGLDPTHATVVLFEDDVLQLVGHLFESGLVSTTDDGMLFNGPAWDDSDKRIARAERNLERLKAAAKRKAAKKKAPKKKSAKKKAAPARRRKRR